MTTAEAAVRIFTRNFVCSSAASLFFMMAYFLFFPTLPIFIKEQGGSESLIGLLVGGSSIVSLTLRPLTGRLVDSIGRKRFLTLGALLMAASSLSYNFVTGTTALWPARLIAGAGLSLYSTASMAYIGDIAPAAKRGRAVSYYGIFNTLALASGPAVGTWLISSGLFAGLERHLRDWLPGQGSHVSDRYNFAVLFVAAFLVSVAALAFTRKVTEVYMPVRTPRQGTRQSLKRPLENMFNGKAIFPAAVFLLTVVNVVSLNIFIPLYNEREVHLGNIGLYYAIFAASILFSRVWTGPLLDRFPRAYAIIPGMGLMALGTIPLGIVKEPWIIFVSGAMVGSGSGVAQPGLQALTIDRAKGMNLGAASSTFAIGQDIGMIGGGALMGVILGSTNFTTFFIVAGMSSVIGMALLTAYTLRQRTLLPRTAARHHP